MEEKIKKVYFFNDLNIEKIINIRKKVNLNNTLNIIISKSGNTIETLSNTFVLKAIKKDSKNIIIISEQKDNFLYKLSKKNNLFYIEHKNYVGGRYSVLSEVGVIPANLMGLNINKLRSRTLKYLKGKNKKFLKESTIKITQLFYQTKLTILFSKLFLLEKPFWCQQLIAESLEKRQRFPSCCV